MGSFIDAATNASAAAPTWQRATLPREADDDEPRAISFAPDGRRGWLVGNDGLVWTTADGGATWTDMGGELEAAAGMIDWTGVFAVDGERVWLGGTNGVLVTQR